MWNYNNALPHHLDNELCHHGVLGMKWGRRNTIGIKEAIGIRKLNKYTALSKKELKIANALAKKQRVMDDPKSWQKKPYQESVENAVKASVASKKLTKKYEDAGQKWQEVNSAIQKMTYVDAKKAKDLYRKTSDKVFKSAGYKFC